MRTFSTGVLPVSGHLSFPVSWRSGAAALILFAALFLAPPAIAGGDGRHAVALFAAFYRSGALVFGDGHVVLPLLQAAVVAPGWVTNEVFLAGYGMAQAVPGPLFTFAAYLGAVMGPAPNNLTGAVITLVDNIFAGLVARLWDAAVLGHAARAPIRSSRHARC